MTRRRLTSLTTATLLAIGLVATPAAASPPRIDGPTSHEHTLSVPGNGQVVNIGPPVCRVEQADRGARNFHLRVHSEMAGAAPVTRAGLQIGFGYIGERGPGCKR